MGARCRDYADNASRVRNRAPLAALIEAITVRQHARRLAGSCSMRTTFRADRSTTTRRCSHDPQVLAREMVVETEHPTLGGSAGARLADQDERHAATRRDVRRCSASTPTRFSRETGFSPEEIVALRRDGIVS